MKNDDKNQEFLDNLQDDVYDNIKAHASDYSLKAKKMSSSVKMALVANVFGIFAMAGVFSLMLVVIRAYLLKY